MKKDKLLTIRIDETLFDNFKQIVEKNRSTMSHELRQCILCIIRENDDMCLQNNQSQ